MTTYSRPRGFVDWKPQKKTQAVLEQVEAILNEYRSNLPLTVRQIYYRLVGAYGYPKTDESYRHLVDYLIMARRSERIPFEHIRDDGVTETIPKGYASVTEFWDERLEDTWFQFHHQIGQDQFIEIWCEAAGMVPLVWRAVGRYGAPVYSCGGFDSLTAKYGAAERMVNRETPTLVLHVGDHDPSGVALFTAVAEDVSEFVDDMGGIVDFRRIAVTPEQIERYTLPTAPAKRTDKRGAWEGGDTVQVEAMPPDALSSEVTQAIRSELDMEVYHQLLQRERTARDSIIDTMYELRERLEEINEENEEEDE